jgi:hypothetical protein
MTGGLLQLVAYGAQDIYLTGNPQITFFKVVYRRHTNFAMEAIQQVFDGVVDFGQKVSCTIARNGDLIGRMYLEVLIDSFEIPVDETDLVAQHNLCGPITKGSVAKTCFMNKLGNGMIKYVEIEIGGQLIDRQYGEWMDIWAQLTKKGYGDHHYNYLVTTDAFCVDDEVGNSLKLYIPLQFWFCDNPGLAIPLIALQYHEVRLNLHLHDLDHIVRFDAMAGLPGIISPGGKDTCLQNEIPLLDTYSEAQLYAKNVFVYQNQQFQQINNKKNKRVEAICDYKARNYLRNNWQKLAIKSCQLYVDYIYLDTDERRRFAQVSHEYLITQVEYTGANAVSKNIIDVNIDLDLNHPVKELIWVIENDPHLNNEIVDNCYKGCIPSCAVDPADRFTWLNNAPTCSIQGNHLGFEYSEPIGNVWFPETINNEQPIGLTSISGMLLPKQNVDPSIIPDDPSYLDNESGNTGKQILLNSRPKSGIRFWEQVDSAVIQLNGHDRFSRRDGRYFKWVQTYQHHSGFEPGINNIYCYSFALKPENHQPSGTCNFSRIDSATLNLKLFKSIIGPKNFIKCPKGATGKINYDSNGYCYYSSSVDRKVRVYATNYNVLRIMSGMGGLAYSN